MIDDIAKGTVQPEDKHQRRPAFEDWIKQRVNEKDRRNTQKGCGETRKCHPSALGTGRAGEETAAACGRETGEVRGKD